MTEIVGHKGMTPGNTLEDFQRAIDCGADRIEFDVLAHKGRLLAAHDVGAVSGDTLTLSQAFGFFSQNDTQLLIDIKTVSRRTGTRIGKQIASSSLSDRTDTVVCGHHLPTLRAIAKAAPAVKVSWSLPQSGVRGARIPAPAQQYTYGEWPGRAPRWLAGEITRGQCDAFTLHHLLVSETLVRRIQGAGGRVFAWTVDDEMRMNELLDWNVDGIITNHPDVLHRVRSVRGEGPITE